MLAIDRNDLVAVRAALDVEPGLAAMPFMDHHWEPPLVYAARTKALDGDLAEILLRHGAEIDAEDVSGRTAFAYLFSTAANQRTPNGVNLRGGEILRPGTEVRNFYNTPLARLFLQERASALSAIRKFMDHGADPFRQVGTPPVAPADLLRMPGDLGLAMLLSQWVLRPARIAFATRPLQGGVDIRGLPTEAAARIVAFLTHGDAGA